MTFSDWTLPVQVALVLGIVWCLLPSLAGWAARIGAGRTRLGYRMLARQPRWRRPVWRWLHPELESAALALLVGISLALVASWVMP